MATFVQPVGAPFRGRPRTSTVAAVPGLATSHDEVLAQRAADGDGDAFAELYERYEERVYNLCYRILGTRDDAADATQEAFLGVLRRLPKLDGRQLAFGSYVFTSARNACYDLIDRRRRAEPSDAIPEHATPVGGGVGGGGVGFDPGDPEDDPERRVLLEARTEEVRAANLELPERQREVLALRELEELSYDEIAVIMDMNRNSVAQLISRARINLRDALRGTALASIAASSPECERALPLIARRQDGQVDAGSEDVAWLAGHLADCDTCRLGREAMEEAGVSYRAWLPIAATPALFRSTMAEAAELAGADWSETIARREAARGAAAAGGPQAGAGASGARAAILRRRRVDVVLIALLATVLLLVGLVGAASDDEPVEPGVPVAEEQPPATERPEQESDEPAKRKPKRDEERPAAAPVEEPTEAEETTSAPVVATPEAKPKPRRTRNRDRTSRPEDMGNEGELTPGVTTEPPPPPPPPPPETTPTEITPDPPPRTCRDAAGLPIPCPGNPGGSTGPPRP